MLHDLHTLTGSLLKSLDILYVKEGNKPCARILFDGNKEILSLLKTNGLSFAVSDFKISKHTDKTRNYSDLAKVSDSGEQLMYVSKDKKIAEKAKKLESTGKHAELGKLLGYPSCCCSFFEKHDTPTYDFTLSSFHDSSGYQFPWFSNNCLRGFDIGLISHFPCSFSCAETRKIAEKNFSAIQKHDPDIARYFAHALKSAVIYSEGVGVYSFKGVKTGIQSYGYAPAHLIASAKNDFYNLLIRRDRIRVVDKNRFFVGEILVEDPQTFFGLFS